MTIAARVPRQGGGRPKIEHPKAERVNLYLDKDQLDGFTGIAMMRRSSISGTIRDLAWERLGQITRDAAAAAS